MKKLDLLLAKKPKKVQVADTIHERTGQIFHCCPSLMGINCVSTPHNKDYV